jgi:hypothetical protein
MRALIGSNGCGETKMKKSTNALIGAAMVGSIFLMFYGCNKLIENAEKQPRVINPEECFFAHSGEPIGSSTAIKTLLRDPKSYEFIEASMVPINQRIHGFVVKFRANNGFGGMTVGMAVGEADSITCGIRSINLI